MPEPNVVKEPGVSTPPGQEGPVVGKVELPKEGLPPAPGVDKGVKPPEEPRIPKSRLDEESAKRHEAEIRTAELEAELQATKEEQARQSQGRVKSQSMDEFLRDYEERTGLDVKALTALTEIQTAQSEPMFRDLLAQQSILTVKVTKNELRQKHEDFTEFEPEMDKELSKLNPYVKSDPQIIERVFYMVRGRNAGKKKGEEELSPPASGKTILSPTGEQTIPQVEGATPPAPPVKTGLPQEVKEQVDKLVEEGWNKEDATDSAMRRYKRKIAKEKKGGV